MLETEIERRAHYFESGATIVASITFIGACISASVGAVLVDWLQVSPARALMLGAGLTWLSSMCGMAWAYLNSAAAANNPRV
jgi:hypothetical protein